MGLIGWGLLVQFYDMDGTHKSDGKGSRWIGLGVSRWPLIGWRGLCDTTPTTTAERDCDCSVFVMKDQLLLKHVVKNPFYV